MSGYSSCCSWQFRGHWARSSDRSLSMVLTELLTFLTELLTHLYGYPVAEMMALAWVCFRHRALGVSVPPKAISHFPGEGDWLGSQMPFCVLGISKHPLFLEFYEGIGLSLCVAAVQCTHSKENCRLQNSKHPFFPYSWQWSSFLIS